MSNEHYKQINFYNKYWNDSETDILDYKSVLGQWSSKLLSVKQV